MKTRKSDCIKPCHLDAEKIKKNMNCGDVNYCRDLEESLAHISMCPKCLIDFYDNPWDMEHHYCGDFVLEHHEDKKRVSDLFKVNSNESPIKMTQFHDILFGKGTIYLEFEYNDQKIVLEESSKTFIGAHLFGSDGVLKSFDIDYIDTKSVGTIVASDDVIQITKKVKCKNTVSPRWLLKRGKMMKNIIRPDDIEFAFSDKDPLWANHKKAVLEYISINPGKRLDSFFFYHGYLRSSSRQEEWCDFADNAYDLFCKSDGCEKHSGKAYLIVWAKLQHHLQASG